MLDLSPGSNDANHCRLLNTIGTVVGLRTPGMDILNDFGDPNREKGEFGKLLI